ncbi:MAG: hypothetical protein IPJ40_02795 [Saprospirales bacterium]|nr:hypothetical protein [Saprospirales bacterium]
MKTTTLFFFLLFGMSIPLSAQVQAGVLDDLEYTATGIDLQILTFPASSIEEMTDSIDVDGDGMNDLIFHVTLANVPDFGGSVTDVSSINPNVEIMTTGYEVTQLQLNDPILPDSSGTLVIAGLLPLISMASQASPAMANGSITSPDIWPSASSCPQIRSTAGWMYMPKPIWSTSSLK